MTRDGTVGRSDATERSLTLLWDLAPVRMMRPRFAHPRSPFSAVTTSKSPSTALAGEREKALAAGCDEFDTKPIEFDRLVKKVHRLLANRRGAPSRV
jgi:CheY-like chemotaxis protein